MTSYRTGLEGHNMKRIGRALLLLLLVVGVAMTVHADERIVNVFAEVDSDEVGLLDTFILTVTVEAENIRSIPKPEVPELKHFSIVNESTRTQSSISIVDGKASRRKVISFVYTLKPEKTGSFTIEPVRIRYGGDVYKTESLSITVVEGQKRKEDGSFVFRDGTAIDMEKLQRDIYVQVKPVKTDLLEGEQLFLTYVLYSRLDIDSISLKQNPSFPGFYIEDIYNATRLEYRREEVDGKMYTTSQIKKVALFPLKAGSFVPEPLILEATVVVKSDDLFDVFGRPFTFDIESNLFEINVKPIPRTPPGSDNFRGIVGSLDATLSSPVYTVRTGESMTCYLTLKSTGNLNVISDPGLLLSSRGRIYLSETMRDTVEEESSVYFVKKFEYTIIPEENGKLVIGTEDITYFDTLENQYITLSAEPLQLSVTGEDISREKPIRGGGRALGIATLQYIKGDVKSLKSVNPSPIQSLPYFIYHVALAVATAAMFLLILKKEKLEKNVGLLRMKRARSSALELLENASKQIDRGNLTDAANAIYRALATYAADKARLSPQDVTGKTANSVLNSIPGIEASARQEYLRLFETCTMIKFSTNRMGDGNALRELKDASINIINDMESSWQKNH
jgi:hypothetical protein